MLLLQYLMNIEYTLRKYWSANRDSNVESPTFPLNNKRLNVVDQCAVAQC